MADGLYEKIEAAVATLRPGESVLVPGDPGSLFRTAFGNTALPPGLIFRGTNDGLRIFGPKAGGVGTGKGQGGDADIVFDTIIQHEGFSATPYWDVNHYRIGFGSDTWTDANGKVHKVTKDTGSVTREDAYRDLVRRVPQFQQDGIIKHVGAQAWKQLSPETQAAVTSLAYNYGSIAELPSLKKAIQSAQPDQIAAAIKARGSDNGGINKSRRTREAAMVTPLAPVVPGPPNRGGSTALAAIDSAFAPSVQPRSASAYAPPGAALQAPPPGASLPTFSRGAIPVPPRNPLPAPLPGRAAALPSQTASSVASVAAQSLPPMAATQPRTTLPAISPMVPTLQAREPWSPLQEMAIARGTQPKPRTMQPPSSTFDLAMQLPGYAANYVPTAQKAAAQPGLTTRKVNTVPIDPRTGGLQPKAADLQAALNQVAAQKAAQQRSASLSAAATSDPVVDPNAQRTNRAFFDNLKATRPPTPPLPPVTMAITQRPPQTNAVPGTVNTATSPAIPTIRANDPRMAPVVKANNGGTNYAAAIPAPTIRAIEEPTRTGTNAFGYPGDLGRLTPGKQLTPAGYLPSPPIMPPKPGAIRTGANNSGLGAPLPASLGNWSKRPGVPLSQQTNPTAQEVVAGIANGTIPHTSAIPRTKGVAAAVNSPGAQMLGRMNMGQSPLLAGLMSMFLPKDGQVSTARSVKPPTYGLQGGRVVPVPPANRPISMPTAGLIASGGNNAWRWIMNNSGDSSQETPRNWTGPARH